jgi:hypothetical protein
VSVAASSSVGEAGGEASSSGSDWCGKDENRAEGGCGARPPGRGGAKGSMGRRGSAERDRDGPMPCKGVYEGTDGAESDMCEPAARITGTGGMSCSGGRGADCTDRPDAERGRGAPGAPGAPPCAFARLESEPNDNEGSCGAPGPSGGDVALIEGLDRRLAPRGGKAATVEPPIDCTGTVGSWGGGDGPRCQETVSPGSRDTLVICETSALPPSAAGGWNSEASDGRGEVAGEDEAEKGLG